MQRPLGPSDLDCPDWLEAMSKVCHKCPLWMPVELQNGAIEWRCAKLVSAQAGVATVQRIEARLDELVKEVNELRNETKKSHDHNIAVGAMAVQRARDAVKETILDVAGIERGGSLEAMPSQEQKAIAQ